jgi:hypothetical protein
MKWEHSPRKQKHVVLSHPTPSNISHIFQFIKQNQNNKQINRNPKHTNIKKHNSIRKLNCDQLHISSISTSTQSFNQSIKKIDSKHFFFFLFCLYTYNTTHIFLSLLLIYTHSFCVFDDLIQNTYTHRKRIDIDIYIDIDIEREILPESHCSPASNIRFPHLVQSIDGGVVITYRDIESHLQFGRHPFPLSHSSSGGSYIPVLIWFHFISIITRTKNTTTTIINVWCDVNKWQNESNWVIESMRKERNETVSTTKTIQLCKICRCVTSFSLTSTCYSITSCTSITFFWHLKIIRFSTINFINQTNKQTKSD